MTATQELIARLKQASLTTDYEEFEQLEKEIHDLESKLRDIPCGYVLSEGE